MISCGELATFFQRSAARAEVELDVPTLEVVEAAAELAKAMIGYYQTGWAPLAASTVAEKTRLGFAPPDNPLLRTGEMRDSIKAEAELEFGGAIGVVGSDSVIAKYQELGTSKIPPRPFLGPGLVQSEPVALKAFGEFAVSLLTPKDTLR